MPRSAPMLGSATATIVTSRTTTNCATQSRARAIGSSVPFLTGYRTYLVSRMTGMWEWLEGVPAIDLTETVRDVRGETVDHLQSAKDLDSWLAAEGDRLPPLPPGERDVAAWRHLRDAIAAAFAATMAGEPLPPEAVDRINACAAPV